MKRSLTGTAALPHSGGTHAGDSENPTARPRTAKILIVDDHPVVLTALRETFGRAPDLEVVGEATTPEQARLACARQVPDLAIVDLTLGAASGLTLVGSLARAYPKLRILVFSMQDERLFAPRALQAGAHGYVGKHEDTSVILRAVRRVLAGRQFVSEVVSDLLLSSLSAKRDARGCLGIARLSDRELEVLRLLGMGTKRGKIASLLGVSTKTVEAHRARIKDKLGIETAAELTLFAVNWVRDGFVGPGP